MASYRDAGAFSFVARQSTTLRAILLPVLLLTAMLLPGCAARPFEASVARFHNAYAVSPGRVVIRPVDPALAQSLEFSTYANMVGRALEQLGYTPASEVTQAELIAEISYQSIARAAPQADRSPVSIGVGVGGVGSNVGVSVGGVFGLGGKDQASPTASQHMLSVRLVPAAGGTAVWEGRASADVTGDNASLSNAMPDLVRALFDGFPGPAGQTTTYIAPTASPTGGQ